MKKYEKDKIKRGAGKGRKALRVITTILWLFTATFIVYNGVSSGENSTAQSSGAVGAVQAVVGVFAPDSWIVGAEGENLQILHDYVRTTAHFLEYCLLGALSVWCYLAWDTQPIGAVLPFCAAFYFPMIDEYLQSRTAGRAAEGADILVDIAGGWSGCAFAFLVALIVWIIVKKRRKRKKII